MLQSLTLRNVGPSAEMAVDFGDRLNVITGDNGLGKSFMLELAWWALTRSWAGAQALPNKGSERTARLEYRLDGKAGPVEESVDFNVDRQGWFHGPGRPPIPGFIVYARVDGSFAVMDPARNDPPDEVDGPPAYRRRPTAFLFSSDEVWAGLKQDGATVCNGLIADWHLWQLEDSREFAALKQMLLVLSPDPKERLEPGGSRRIDLFDARDIPTLRLPYGEVPITHVSAGARRILALSYLLVWAWHEHRAASELLGEPPSDRVTLLIDEVEAHLHPRWQRVILSAVVEALLGLGAPEDSQVIAVTHSPLVLASLEGRWDQTHDRLFTLDLVGENGDRPHVQLMQPEWRPRGDVNRWLTSEIFGLAQPRSRSAEEFIEEIRDTLKGTEPSTQELRDLARELAKYVPDTDPLLARLDMMASSKEE